jgi:branched-chain amino acid transport system ATP-binding protein
MLAIARGLMNSPVVLLMDEPTIGLAPFMVEILAQSILKLGRSGISIILVEQNVRVALDFATRCYVMELGEIVLSGSAKDIADDERVKQAYLGRQ